MFFTVLIDNQKVRIRLIIREDFKINLGEKKLMNNRRISLNEGKENGGTYFIGIYKHDYLLHAYSNTRRFVYCQIQFTD